MPVTNCRRCGRLYNRISRNLCPECLKEEDEAYKIVRAYLRQHPDTYMGELCEETGVQEDLIVEMVRDGRLILSNHPHLSYACERCGEPTQSGSYCAKCAQEMESSFRAVSQGLRNKGTDATADQRLRTGYYSKE